MCWSLASLDKIKQGCNRRSQAQGEYFFWYLLPLFFSGCGTWCASAIVRPRKRQEQSLVNTLGEWWPFELVGMLASAFVRGHQGFVKVHKLPRQEEPLLFSATDSWQQQLPTFFFFFLTQATYCSYPADSLNAPPLRVADGDSSPDVAAFMFIWCLYSVPGLFIK